MMVREGNRVTVVRIDRDGFAVGEIDRHCSLLFVAFDEIVPRFPPSACERTESRCCVGREQLGREGKRAGAEWNDENPMSYFTECFTALAVWEVPRLGEFARTVSNFDVDLQ